MSTLTTFIVCISFILFNCIHVRAQCEGLRDGFYADTEQCDKYVKCLNQTVKEVSVCPDGLVFNEFGNVHTARCELPFNIDCSTRPALQPAQSNKQCPRKYGMWPHPTDCSRFVQCADGVAYPNACAPGLAFNPKNGICDWPENVGTCSAPAEGAFECPPLQELFPQHASAELLHSLRQFQLHIQTRHAHPEDCAQLYVCVFGGSSRIARTLKCEYGKVFNSESGECDLPQYVSGCERYYESDEDGTVSNTDGNSLA